MAAPTLDAVATTGGRFGSALEADDPTAVKAAVLSGVYQACKGQLYDEVQRLRPLIASGSDAELAAALRVTSLALANAAAAVAEADAVLRLRGLADDPDLMPHWRDRLNDNIHRAGLVLAAMQRYPPERGRMQGQQVCTPSASAHPTGGTGAACGRPVVIGRLRHQAPSMA